MRNFFAVVAGLAVCMASIAHADVKTQERTQLKFEGMLGTMMGLFGGKAAKEGIVSSVAIKGDRKLESTGDTGEIVDLAEEKVYRLDFKKKTYTVVTFAELRRQASRLFNAEQMIEDCNRRVVWALTPVVAASMACAPGEGYVSLRDVGATLQQLLASVLPEANQAPHRAAA